jgi:small-conductance mechanosensitive channel
MDTILYIIKQSGSTVGTIAFFLILHFLVRKLLNRQMAGKSDKVMIRQIILFSIALIGFIAVILALPMSAETKGQITSLMGIVISAVLALSSATFIGNILAGVLLRSINSFKPGDFIKVQEHFGRVSDRSLFHTEIQTINRDLITLPNLYLATHPVKVTRSSGTFISASVSLGYDVNRNKIQKALMVGAENAGLKEAFVLITELGDYSIIYKIHGLLEDVKRVITAESNLYASIIDSLHDAGIEIVSPSFMNQRQVGDTVFIPKKVRKKDEADKAASIENRKEKLSDVNDKIKNLQEELKTIKEDDAKEEIKTRIEKWTKIKDGLTERIEDKIDEIKKES